LEHNKPIPFKLLKDVSSLLKTGHLSLGEASCFSNRARGVILSNMTSHSCDKWSVTGV